MLTRQTQNHLITGKQNHLEQAHPEKRTQLIKVFVRWRPKPLGTGSPCGPNHLLQAKPIAVVFDKDACIPALHSAVFWM
jgi:hypothetical protein